MHIAWAEIVRGRKQVENLLIDTSGTYLGDTYVWHPFSTTGGTVDPNWRGLPTPQPSTFYPAAQPAPSISAWQCPGCGTYYAYWVSKCECQKRNQLTTGSFTTFTGSPLTPAEERSMGGRNA